MSFGFVIGNGESRLSVPSRMIDDRDTWACNLAYRDFAPKNLICCDKHILMTAVSQGAGNKSKIWTREKWFSSMSLEDVESLPEDFPWTHQIKHDQPTHWGSGSYAALLACKSEHDILVFIGFDLWPTKDNLVNNVFKGEKGYGPKDAGPVSPEGWIHQMCLLMRYYPEKQFVFLNYPSWKPPAQWAAFENFNHDDLKQLNNL